MSDIDSAEGTGISPREPDGLCGELFDHWKSLCAGSSEPDGLPVRDQVDMLTLPTPTLPWFFLHERQDGRFRSIIAGTKIVDGIGFEPKGRFIDEIFTPEIYDRRRTMFDRCLDRGQPFYYSSTLAEPTWRYIGNTRLLLPLHQEAGGPVNMLCGLVLFFDRNELSAPDQMRIDRGYKGLLHCNTYRDGRWHRCSSEEADGGRGQPAA